MGAFVEFENVSKIYKTGDVEVHALTDASFEIQRANSASSSVNPAREKRRF